VKGSNIVISRILLAVALCATIQAADVSKSKTKAGKDAKKLDSLTGCVDERGDKYVLAGLDELKKITTLKGEGFSDDNFARHVGHKVTVEGAQEGEIFKVRFIRTLGETCSPEKN
jgi:hypothetical protein